MQLEKREVIIVNTITAFRIHIPFLNKLSLQKGGNINHKNSLFLMVINI